MSLAVTVRAGALMVAMAAAPWATALAATARPPAAMSGIWRIETPITAVRTIDGKAPPLRPEAAKLYQEHLAMRQQGDTSYDSATWCASAGMPRVMLINSPFELVVRPPYVAFLHEWNWWARVVYFEGALSKTPGGAAMQPAPGEPPPGGPPGGGPPSPGAPTGADGSPGAGPLGFIGGPPEARASFSEATGPMGLSRGKFDGEVLVIDTSALRDSTLIDNSGLPHSDMLRITERLRMRGADVLEDRIRIDDFKTFTAPWETVVRYRRQKQEIREDVCLDRIKTGEPAISN